MAFPGSESPAFVAVAAFLGDKNLDAVAVTLVADPPEEPDFNAFADVDVGGFNPSVFQTDELELELEIGKWCRCAFLSSSSNNPKTNCTSL